ncbi:type II secretion system protein [Lentisphaera marina]|uniref:type II secretion system protein n=1 Tax=Lentisphaera marina TaxID=1111041 RepID=UPI00236682EF|nr:type II secretion system protein [Lentisphaera marina]MDD7987204.1 type II secretion system protein [Lentisphaera marina]
MIRYKKFSLIELLVVIAIIGVLSSMLLPVLSKGRQKAFQATCANNIRQIGTAAYMYSEDWEGLFPFDYSGDSSIKALTKNGFMEPSLGNWVPATAQCPMGLDVSTDGWKSNVAMNWKFDPSSSFNISSDLFLNSGKGSSERMVYMDSYNAFDNMYKGYFTSDKIFHSDKKTRIARHQDKANVYFQDGHLAALSGVTLLTFASTYDQSFWRNDW